MAVEAAGGGDREASMSWPDGGPWVVAPTSTTVNWAVAVAALQAASETRTAVLHLVGPRRLRETTEPTVEYGTEGRPADGPAEVDVDGAQRRRVSGVTGLPGPGTHVEVHAGAEDPLRLDDLVGLVQALGRTHGLVLVGGGPGLLVPLGQAGWTLADLAWALRAPVVLVTDAGPDAANSTSLALEVLAGRGLATSVIEVDAGEDLGGLPVAPAGRIPPGAAVRPESFRDGAVRWLHPMLHASRGRARAGAKAAPDRAAPERAAPDRADPDSGDAEASPPLPGHPDKLPGVPGAAPPWAAVRSSRVLVVLVPFLVASLLLLCALNSVLDGDGTGTAQVVVRASAVATAQRMPNVVPAPVPSRAAPCPSHAAVPATRPDPAVTARVDAAWSRIERWLAAHAPATRRTLRPPASQARITAQQQRMSVAFPADLVASLRRHDGATARDGFHLPPFYRPMSVDEIARDWKVGCPRSAGLPAGNDWWHPSFVPFASVGDGGSLLVDQRPGGQGRVGEFYPEDGTRFGGWPASIVELLEGVARSLETGEPYPNGYRPVVESGGRLGWRR